jgi:hypothetical protein
MCYVAIRQYQEKPQWEANVIARKLLTISAAAAMAIAPTVAYGASPLTAAPAARAGASTDNASDLRGGVSAQMTLGFLVLLAILLVVLGGDDEGPNNPVSP